MTTRIRFKKEITIAYLGRRFFIDELFDAEDSDVDYLVSNEFAVVEQETTPDAPPVDDTPTKRVRKAKPDDAPIAPSADGDAAG